MTRTRLPARRPNVTLRFEHAFPGQQAEKWLVTVGFYDDGRPAELFIDGKRQTSALGLLGHEAAVVASIALQHGAGLDELREALVRDEIPPGTDPDTIGNPHSVLGSALDALARFIAEGVTGFEAGDDAKGEQ